MSSNHFQDWEPKVLVKNINHLSATEKKNTIINATRKGETLSVKKNNANPEHLHLKKIENEQETFKHETISLDLRKQIAQARNNAKLTQKDLAALLNLPPGIIKDYEVGKVIPNKMIISKIKRALGEHWK
jgi:ribosome-binding protein aMBF1 (putative translation factor)